MRGFVLGMCMLYLGVTHLLRRSAQCLSYAAIYVIYNMKALSLTSIRYRVRISAKKINTRRNRNIFVKVFSK